MADAIISVILNRLAALMQEQIRNHVNLVRGVDKEVESLSNELNTVRNVLEDAEKKGCKDKTVKDWLMRLENTSYEMDDVLDEWNYSILKFQIEQSDDAADNVVPPKKKVLSFIPTSCICFKKFVIRHDIALKIKQVKGRLDLILAEKDRYGFMTSEPSDPSRASWRVQSTSLIDLEEVCGRDLEKENLVSKLVSEGGRGEELGVSVLSVVGVGGLGKTTLAKLAYNDSRVGKCFQLRIWICVSDTFDEVGIANGIIEEAGGSKPETNHFEIVLKCLKETISGKNFLLVLDDVWTEDDTKWEPLKDALNCGGASSKILVTTRNGRVAIMMGAVKNEVHHLGHLSHEQCWLLLARIAFSTKNKEECENFQNIGKEIAKKCKGLPLAAKTLGSLLRFKNTLKEWENVLNSEIWELEKVKVDLFPHLLLSYNELSPALKRCFSYCALFPKDTKINVESLITKWMAMGYIGSSGSNVDDWRLKGREYFNKLAMCSLFQDFEKCLGYDYKHIESFKMHDIIHDFARFLRKNGELMKKTSCQTCSPLLVLHVKEYRSLFHSKEFRNLHLCDCLTSVRLLSLRYRRLRSIPKEIEKLIHLRWLDLGSNEFPDEHLKSICKLYSLQFLWVDHCELLEIPQEIGNLIHLKHLDLSWNKLQKELPESLCGLIELESLNVHSCGYLIGLPQRIHKLKNLKHLYNDVTRYLRPEIPLGVAELTNLVTLSEFYCGGRHKSKLRWLKNLNQLSGSLTLMIELSCGGDSEEETVVEDAHEAELRKKMHIQQLQISFHGSVREEDQSVWEDLINALEPHPNLQNLSIWDYKGSRLPRWIESPLNQLRSIFLSGCEYLLSLPPLGKLPLLESFVMQSNYQLQFIGREFLGIKTSEASSPETMCINTNTNTIGFPKLQELTIWDCSEWKVWEDITADEEDFVAVSVMPCLMKLAIRYCDGLTELPHRLLLKVSSSLKVLDISGSTQLQQVYGDKEGQPWKSISRHNPHLDLQHD